MKNSLVLLLIISLLSVICCNSFKSGREQNFAGRHDSKDACYGLFQYSGASDWSDNIVRYCVSINDAQTTEGAGSFFIWNGSNERNQITNCLIYNNVVYSSSAPVISFENSSSHKKFTFCNNIFLSSGQVMTGLNTGSSFIGNVWWNAGGSIEFMEFNSLAEWAQATGQEMLNGKVAGIQAYPGLKGPFTSDITDPYQLNTLYGYTLQSGSSLRNKGLDLTSMSVTDLPGTDFYGNPVPSGVGPDTRDS